MSLNVNDPPDDNNKHENESDEELTASGDSEKEFKADQSDPEEAVNDNIVPNPQDVQANKIPLDTSDAKLLSTCQKFGLVNVRTGSEILTKEDKAIFKYAEGTRAVKKVNYIKCKYAKFITQYTINELKSMEANPEEDHYFIKEMKTETRDWRENYNISDPSYVTPVNLNEMTNEEKSIANRYITFKKYNLNNLSNQEVGTVLNTIKWSRIIRHRFMRANMRFEKLSERVVSSTKTNDVKQQLSMMKDSGIITSNELSTYRRSVFMDMRKARTNMFEFFTLDLFSTDADSDLYTFVKSNAFATNMNKTVFIGFNPRVVRNQFFSNVYNYMKKKGIGGFTTATKISHISETKLMKKNLATYSRIILTQIITLLMTRGTNLKKYKNGVNGTKYCSNLIKLLFAEFHVYPKNVPGTTNFLSYPRIASSYPVISSYVNAQVPSDSMVLRDFDHLPKFAQHNNFACLIPFNYTKLAQVAFVWNVKFSEIINSKKNNYIYRGTIFLAMLCTKMLSQLEKMWYIRRMLLDHEISPLVLTDSLDVSGALSSIDQNILNDKSYKAIVSNSNSMDKKYEDILKMGMDSNSDLLTIADFNFDGRIIVDPMKL